MTIDSELSRVGISLPKNLLDKFDEIINYRGYSSRSEGIRDAIRSYITYYKWMSDVRGERQGVITMIYDRCLEVILVRGDGSDLKTLAERLMSQKGVESVKLTTIPIQD
jgi:CopG family nickel-responsive transcriptional regulator